MKNSSRKEQEIADQVRNDGGGGKKSMALSVKKNNKTKKVNGA